MIEQILEDVDDFEEPKINLEQYKTRPHLAACMLHSAKCNLDIEDKIVVDLGCGTGCLSLGAVVLEAKKVYRVVERIFYENFTKLAENDKNDFFFRVSVL